MRTLILSCNTGEGHNACARAIKEYYDMMGKTCQIVDSLSFVSEEVSSIVAKGHVLIYRRLAPLFGWGYDYAQNHPQRFDSDSILYHFFARGAEALNQFMLDNGYTHVICTHPFSALMLTEVRKRYPTPIRTAFVATDYTCCPGVNCSELELYFIPDPLLEEEFARQGVPKEKLRASGIPIRQAFYVHQPARQAKEACGVDPAHKHVVLACGSMGCGPMGKLSQAIAEQMGPKTELSIVCGTNEQLKRTMDEIHGQDPKIHVRGFVKDMPLLLDSADVYVTKPGGLSTTEAAAKHCPMVLVNAVGGCESYNLNHFLRAGKALTGEHVTELVDACLRLLNRSADADAKESAPVRNAAKYIYETMEERQGP